MTGKMQRSRKYTHRRIFFKAIYSSIVGLPISMALTYAMVHAGFIQWASTYFPAEYGWFAGQIIASGLISMPFFVASFTRMDIIDYVYQKYNMDISPQHVLFVLYCRIKQI